MNTFVPLRFLHFFSISFFFFLFTNLIMIFSVLFCPLFLKLFNVWTLAVNLYNLFLLRSWTVSVNSRIVQHSLVEISDCGH